MILATLFCISPQRYWRALARMRDQLWYTVHSLTLHTRNDQCRGGAKLTQRAVHVFPLKKEAFVLLMCHSVAFVRVK